jgi:PilZ domain
MRRPRQGGMLGAVPMSNAERRRFPRYDVSRLPGVVDGFRLFETLKISAGGALILVAAELALEQRVQVALELVDLVFRSSAFVVFVGPDFSAPGLFRVGLAFVDTEAGDQERLQRFIERSVAAGELR